MSLILWLRVYHWNLRTNWPATRQTACGPWDNKCEMSFVNIRKHYEQGDGWIFHFYNCQNIETISYRQIKICDRKGMILSNVGSVVEFSPATREARVRFPDVADFWLFNFWNSLMKNSRDARPKSERGLSLVRGISFRIQGLEIKIWGKGRIKYKRFILEPI